jgi:hypothetical protein
MVSFEFKRFGGTPGFVGDTLSVSLPPEVASFLAQHIDSVEQLEILLLLRMDRSRTWTPSELATEMRTTEGSAATRLTKLLAHGLVSRTGDAYRFAPADAAVEASVAAVATTYVSRRYVVIQAIFEPRASTLQAFADAFKIRDGNSGNKGGGGDG